LCFGIFTSHPIKADLNLLAFIQPRVLGEMKVCKQCVGGCVCERKTARIHFALSGKQNRVFTRAHFPVSLSAAQNTAQRIQHRTHSFLKASNDSPACKERKSSV
jgi:hypothetical protein